MEIALTRVARPNPLVVIWRWRYELALAFGVLVGTVALVVALGVVWTAVAEAALVGTIAAWPTHRRYFIARAWCVITPHRVRTGCGQAWIHSRQGKIPIVLFTTRQPFGERVRVWCRAGTSAADFVAARELLIAACWAQDVRIARSSRFAQLVMLDVIRHVQGQAIDRRAGAVPASPSDSPVGPDDHGWNSGFPTGDDVGRVA